MDKLTKKLQGYDIAHAANELRMPLFKADGDSFVNLTFHDFEKLATALASEREVAPADGAEVLLAARHWYSSHCGTKAGEELLHAVERFVRDEPAVAGRMEMTFAQHTRRLGLLITEEQEKPLPNNALIAALCDSIRLAREAIAVIAQEQAGQTAQAPVAPQAVNSAIIGTDGREHFRVTAGCYCGWSIINDFEWQQHLKQITPPAAPLAEGQPPREQVKRALQIASTDNWDGQGALSIGQDAQGNSMFLCALANALYKCKATIEPNPNGTLSVEWESGKYRAAVEIGKTRVTAYGTDGDRTALFDGKFQAEAPQGQPLGAGPQKCESPAGKTGEAVTQGCCVPDLPQSAGQAAPTPKVECWCGMDSMHGKSLASITRLVAIKEKIHDYLGSDGMSDCWGEVQPLVLAFASQQVSEALDRAAKSVDYHKHSCPRCKEIYDCVLERCEYRDGKEETCTRCWMVGPGLTPDNARKIRAVVTYAERHP